MKTFEPLATIVPGGASIASRLADGGATVAIFDLNPKASGADLAVRVDAVTTRVCAPAWPAWPRPSAGIVIVALYSEFREGAVDPYLDAPATIPDDLAATFARIGITDCYIWRTGQHLISSRPVRRMGYRNRRPRDQFGERRMAGHHRAVRRDLPRARRQGGCRLARAGVATARATEVE